MKGEPRQHEYLTPPEVAELLRVRAAKVRTWIESGELPAVDVSERKGGRKRLRIRRQDLDAFLEARSFQASVPERSNRGRPVKQFPRYV